MTKEEILKKLDAEIEEKFLDISPCNKGRDPIASLLSRREYLGKTIFIAGDGSNVIDFLKEAFGGSEANLGSEMFWGGYVAGFDGFNSSYSPIMQDPEFTAGLKDGWKDRKAWERLVEPQ